ncbi:MAG: PAS domain-containing protein [Gammaproteobacteria bacterium]|nr:PAS domain-containing protein [Gammaproteobacteria bacterium]
MNTMNLKELEQAFGVFNHASSGLEHAYASLEKRLQALTDELKQERAERRQGEEERNRIERELDCLIDVLPGAVVVLDGDGRVRQGNSAAERLFGNEIVDQCWSEISRRHLQRVGHGSEFAGPGDRRLSLARRSLSPDPGQILLFTDVTENRAIDALSEQHARLASMGEMAAALAHQIRTPLAAALLYASSAASEKATQAQRETMFAKLVDRLHDLEFLVNDMLLFARGGSPVNATVAIQEILLVAATNVRPRLLPAQKLRVRRSDPELLVQGSEQALAGALINLINNALDAAGENAEVCVAVRKTSGGNIELRVSDNGPGIAAGDEQKIFEPFVSGRPGGTGLGLAVVRSVARQHGGDSWAEPGHARGACVVLQLPALASKPGTHAEVAA